jgi:hypothetical protein
MPIDSMSRSAHTTDYCQRGATEVTFPSPIPAQLLDGVTTDQEPDRKQDDRPQDEGAREQLPRRSSGAPDRERRDGDGEFPAPGACYVAA